MSNSIMCRLENPPEAGILPEAVVKTLDSDYQDAHAERRASGTAASTSSSVSSAFVANGSSVLYPPSERGHIRDSWKHLMRWSRAWRTAGENGTSVMGRLEKVCVWTVGGGAALHQGDSDSDFQTACVCRLSSSVGDPLEPPWPALWRGKSLS